MSTTDLRDRITKVLKDFAPAMHKHEAAWCADAVITELGLRREQVQLLHRWVTAWATDE